MAVSVDILQNWIAGLKSGDEKAARYIYDSYARAMYNTLIRITGSSEEAQDLLQDAFVSAFKAIDSYRGDATFGAWLKRIVVNTGLEHLRKRKIDFERWNEEETTFIDDPTPDVELSPELVHRAIKALPDGTRAVLSLYLLEGYNHEEISGILSISQSTSKTQLMRGKSMLRQQLKSIAYDEN